MLANAPDPSRSLRDQDTAVLLAMLVWGEARNQPAAARLAVAYVPITRWRNLISRLKARNHSWSVALHDIALRRFQFSCFNDNDPNRMKLLHPIEYEGLGTWVACWRTAVEALSGQSINPAPGATHYCVKKLWSSPAAVASRPQWFEQPEIAAGRTKFIAEIGDHVFARAA